MGSITGLYRLKLLKYVSVSTTITRSSAMTVDGFRPFYHPETVLLLHTSGTSVQKKLVPYSLNMVVIQQCLPIAEHRQPAQLRSIISAYLYRA